MNIKIEFMNGSDFWKTYVLVNGAKASAILSDPDFIAKVRAWPGFDFTGDTSDQIADKLEHAKTVTIKVGFYSKWWSRAIAYEQDGCVYFNTAKRGAGDVGNLVHECLHAPPFNYSHNGNSPAGQANTVPWRVGEWAGEWMHAQPMRLAYVPEMAVVG